MSPEAVPPPPPAMIATVPADYARLREQAAALLDPLLALAAPGRADLPLEGPPSDHGEAADRLESFARPMLLAAQYLTTVPDGTEADAARRARAAEWFRAGLGIGTDPDSPHFWGWATHYHQHTVEQGLMTLALRLAQEHLWDPLPERDRALLLRWFASARGVGHVRNNHLFFDLLVLEFLGWAGAGEPGDDAAIDHDFSELEAMARGNGWFIDGMNETFDHYNAFAFHYYAPLWNHFYGHRNPARAARWRAWTAEFLTGYEAWFAASGETVAFGRSLSYRFNGAAAFGAAIRDGTCPLPPGRARRLVLDHIAFFLRHPVQQSQGALGLGWTDVFPGIMEPYSCAGSPYWSAKAFIPLTLPPDHPFWTAPAEPAGAARGDAVTVLPGPGFVLRAIDGEVELLTATTAINTGNMHRYGPWKWGRLSYRTRFGFTLGQPQGDYPIDGSLTAVADGLDRRLGRHWTLPLEVSADRLSALYILGDKLTQRNVRVRSTIRWNGHWQLQIHHVDPFTPAVLTLGAQALPLRAGEAPRIGESASSRVASAGGLTTAIHALAGFDEAGIESWSGAERARRHILAPDHATPWLRTSRLTKPTVLVALVYAGPADAYVPWRLVSASARGDGQTGGRIELLNPDGVSWVLEDQELPSSLLQ